MILLYSAPNVQRQCSVQIQKRGGKCCGGHERRLSPDDSRPVEALFNCIFRYEVLDGGAFSIAQPGKKLKSWLLVLNLRETNST